MGADLRPVAAALHRAPAARAAARGVVEHQAAVRRRAPTQAGRAPLRLDVVEADAARAARNTVAIVHRGALAAVADTCGGHLLRYASAWNEGSAADRGAARDLVEPSLPPPDWLARLTEPSQGRIVTAEDACRLLQPR